MLFARGRYAERSYVDLVDACIRAARAATDFPAPPVLEPDLTGAQLALL